MTSRQDVGLALLQEQPEGVARTCAETAARFVRTFERTLPRALSGRQDAVRSYVRAWRECLAQLLEAVHVSRPDLVAQAGGRFLLVDVKGRPSGFAMAVIEQGAVDAPFSPWLARFGRGLGVVLDCVSRIRRALPGVGPLLADGALPHWDVDPADVRRFIRLVHLELEAEDAPLQRVADVFDLSLSELGRLFGVSRQAVAQWMQAGVPPSRQAKVATILSIGELLRRKLRPGLVPAVARRAAEAYAGSSLLDAIARDRHQEALDSIRGSFDWSSGA